MAEQRPNLILIISDDMGYADLPTFGESDIDTPHLDRLAATGALFREGYVTAPICSPSRMAIHTGRYHQRFGHYDIYRAPGEREHFERFMEAPMLAEVLSPAGYRCGAVGKWHMGNIEEPNGCHPLQRGFDEFVGIPRGMSDYMPGARLFDGYDEFPAPEYLTNYWGAKACEFIERHGDRPFFLHLGFNAVHAPLQAVSDDLDAVGEYPSPDRKTYAAMLRCMDANIGRVLDALDRLGLAENTVVAFINDNGGGGNHTPDHTRNTGRNAPLRGFKFDLYEGGIRVPYLLRWPGAIPAGLACDAPVSALDLFPTFLGAAGVEPPPDDPGDGVDLLPYLQDAADGEPHDVLCWKNRTWAGETFHQHPLPGCYNKAVRKGPWKLVALKQLEGNDPPEPCHLYDQPWQLFDLSRDVGEQHDLAAEYPHVVDELAADWNAWHEQLARPCWL